MKKNKAKLFKANKLPITQPISAEKKTVEKSDLKIRL